MPLLVVRLPSWLRAGSLLGEAVERRWSRLAAAAGLDVAFEGEGDLAADGRVLTLEPDHLRAVRDGASLVLEDPAASDDATEAGDERTVPRITAEDVQADVGLVVAAAGALARLVGRREPVPDARPLDPWWHAPVRDVARLRGLEGRLLARRHEAEIARGVRFVGAPPFLGPEVELEPGATIWSGAVLVGRTRVAAGAVVRVGCHLTDTTVAAGAVVEPYTVAERAEVGPGARVGPFAHLREGSVLKDGARVGNFVETKKAVLGEGAKANHLTYLGDCEVGPRTNVGAGTITCNYDGAAKHRTTIGADVFVGTHTSLVAPLVVGDEALIAAGSVVTEDVPPGALVVARAEQRTLADKGRAILARNRARASGAS